MKKRVARSTAADLRDARRAEGTHPTRGHAGMGAGELRRFKLSKDLLQKQLGDSIGKLIKDLTGLQLHIIWHDPFDSQRSGRALALCPGHMSSRAARNTKGRECNPNACEGCLDRDWKPAVSPFDGGHRFTGPCGVETFKVAIDSGGNASPLTLALQARTSGGNGRSREAVSAGKFEQAIALLHLLKRDLETALRASTAETALLRLHRRLPVLRKEAQLVRVVQKSDSLAEPVLPGRTSHSQRIVHRMVSYVHDHFHRPMTLSQVASAVGMNASYLSSLFSKQLGMTFHEYLVEVRMARARQLLAHPHRRVGDVALAVGYASADQFRHAFKTHAGVPPSQWR